MRGTQGEGRKQAVGSEVRGTQGEGRKQAVGGEVRALRGRGQGIDELGERGRRKRGAEMQGQRQRHGGSNGTAGILYDQ